MNLTKYLIVILILSVAVAKAQTVSFVQPTTFGQVFDPINTNAKLGVIPGQGSVSPTGAGVYTVPIEVPSGINGMTPQLSFSYNSMGGDGVLGRKWGLSGLAQITRGGSQYYVDGKKSVAKHEKLDAYYLNGARLNYTSTSTGLGYGQSGARYHERVYSEAFVEAVGSESSGPAWFKKHDLGGLTTHFGNEIDYTSNSRMNHQDGTRLVWAISRMEDCYGNTINYVYEDQASSNGQLYIKEITYGGNVNTGEPAKYTISFHYENKSNFVAKGFSNGFLTYQSEKVLTRVTVEEGGNLIRTYHLKYANVNNHCVLQEIGQALPSGLLNPTIIQTGKNDYSYGTVSTDLASFNSPVPFEEQVGDFNSDGYSDIIRFAKMGGTTGSQYDSYTIYLNDKSGGFDEAIIENIGGTGGAISSGGQAVVRQRGSIEVNGDMATDVVVSDVGFNSSGDPFLENIQVDYGGLNVNFGNPTNSTWNNAVTIQANSTFKFLPDPFDPANGLGNNILSCGDFNGDGLTDFLYPLLDASGNQKTFISLAGGINIDDRNVEVQMVGSNPILWDYMRNVSVIDFDGDSDSELHLVDWFGNVIVFDFEVTYSSSVPTCIATETYFSSGEFPTFSGIVADDIYFYPLDINSDAITDFVISIDGGANWQFFFGRGDDLQGYAGSSYSISPLINFATVGFTGQSPLFTNENCLGDFDGDGYIDIVSRYGGGLDQIRMSSFNGNLNSPYSTQYQTNSFNVTGVPSLVGDFNADGIADILTHELSGGFKKIIYLNQYFAFDQVLNIRDGFKNITSYDYNTLPRLMATGQYSLGSSVVTFPFVKPVGGINVCARLGVSDHKAGTANTFYKYEGFVADRHGSGLFGVQKTKITSNLSDLEVEIESILNTSMHMFIPSSKTTRDLSSQLTTGTLASTNEISKEQIYLFVNIVDPSRKIFKTQLDKSIVFDYLNASSSRSVMNWQGPHSSKLNSMYSYAGESLLSTNAQYTEAVFFEVYSLDCNGLPGDAININRTKTRQGETPITEMTINTYDPNTGKLTNVVDYIGEAYSTQTSFVYDAYGNVTQSMVSASGLPNLSTSVIFGYGGRYPINGVNALGQTAPNSKVFNPKWGLWTKLVGLNGNESFISYDDMGRVSSKTDVYGNTTNFTYEWAVSSGTGISLEVADNSVYKVVETGWDGFVQTSFYDRKGNLRLTTNNHGAKTATTYTPQGRADLVSNIFSNASDLEYTDHNYDDLGRLTSSTGSNGGVSTTYSYLDPTLQPKQNLTTVTSTLGNSSKRYDCTGVVLSAQDNGGTLQYFYNSNNLPVEIVLNGTTVSLMKYDNKGRQTQLDESASGVTSYTYDAYDRLISQTTGGSYDESFYYNNLGQLVETRTNNNAIVKQSRVYYTSGSGINQLAQEQNNQGMITEYTYNPFGAVELLLYPTENVQCFYAYDASGRIEERSVNFDLQRFKYDYSSNGRLQTIWSKSQNENNWTSLASRVNTSVYGRLTTREDVTGQYIFKGYDHYGRVTSENYPGIHERSYNWDNSTGNLNYRADALNSLQEDFTYDNLNRLTDIYDGATQVAHYSYDNLGNFSFKEDVGEFAYNAPYKNTYVENPNSSPNQINVNASQIRDFNYENELRTLKEGDYLMNITMHSDNHTRYRAITSLNGIGQIEERKYFSSIGYETYTNNQTNTKYNVFYESMAGELVAMVVKEDDGSGNNISNPGEGYHSVITDHLGSISLIYDQNGQVVAKQSFDAWGRFRNPDDWTYTTGSITNPEWLTRGYTGHEHLQHFNLIHMNGRVYAPLEGRMLSPDNYVQSPNYSQSYNRYSYVFNNPLKYNDPSGEIIFTAATLIAAPFTGGASLALLPMAIGADIGMWQGGSIANGTMNPLHWKPTAKTFGYMAAGAGIGAASGGLANAAATSGMVFASTAGIMAGSFTNSVGMAILSGGQTDVSIGFGFCSYNISRGEFGYFGKTGNSALENIGYALGAMANASDILAGFNPGEVELQTENLSNPVDGVDLVGHSQLNHNGEVLIDFGPAGNWKKFEPGRNDWINYATNGEHNLVSELSGNKFRPIAIKGVNLKRLERISNGLNDNPGTYQVLTRSCSSTASRALSISGVPALGLHPYLLHGQMYLRSLGVRPSLYSYYGY